MWHPHLFRQNPLLRPTPPISQLFRLLALPDPHRHLSPLLLLRPYSQSQRTQSPRQRQLQQLHPCLNFQSPFSSLPHRRLQTNPPPCSRMAPVLYYPLARILSLRGLHSPSPSHQSQPKRQRLLQLFLRSLRCSSPALCLKSRRLGTNPPPYSLLAPALSLRRPHSPSPSHQSQVRRRRHRRQLLPHPLRYSSP